MESTISPRAVALLVENLNEQAHDADLWPSPTFRPSTTSQEVEEALAEFHEERDSHYDWLRSVARWLRYSIGEGAWAEVADTVEQLVYGEALHACLIDIIYGNHLCECGTGHFAEDSLGLPVDECRMCGRAWI